MRFSPSMLAGPALIAALCVAPVAGSPAAAAEDLSRTSVGIAQDSAAIAAKPPKDRAKKKQYNTGHSAGFTEGRRDCRFKSPYSLRVTSSGPFHRGYRDGYNSGFLSC